MDNRQIDDVDSRVESLKPIYPGQTWLQYESPEEAGFSSESLEKAKRYFEAISDPLNASAFLVVFNGAIVVGWGEITRRFKCHSIRKAFMSALYGIHVAEGDLDLSKTLADLNIDDDPPLLDSEKQARIIDVLKSMSGVYHPAAYDVPTQKKERPERGSHKPGTHFRYNNWDFNVQCAIFNQETGVDFFDAFRRSIVDPLQMEDFRPHDAHYMLERELSIHPAYRFRMSARDLARFGLLFLRDGKWHRKQIIPSQWVTESTAPHHWDGDWGWGYFWSCFGPRFMSGRLHKLGAYLASGVGGQGLIVVPKANLMLVTRAETFRKIEGWGPGRLSILYNLTLDAQDRSPSLEPSLIPYETPERAFRGIQLESSIIERYLGDYELDDGSTVKIEKTDERLMCVFILPARGAFELVPLSETLFIIEDFEIPLVFEVDHEGNPLRMTMQVSPDTIWKGKRKQ